jgi:RimJ/RimL family protein N-acetyltransferase
VEDESGGPIGSVRFDIEDDYAEISVSLDKDQRGRGYGATSIRRGSDLLMQTAPVKRVVALVKSNNPGSLAAFQRAGFIIQKTKLVAGAETTKLIYDQA